MRFPSFNPINLPPREEARYVPVEEDILLAKKEVADAQRKYDETKSVIEKINLEEATMRLEFLEEEKLAANEPTLKEDKRRA